MDNRVDAEAILSTVRSYYSDKVRTYGATPRGADWNSAESQELRFSQLLKLTDGGNQGSILDYGCGYGALLDFLMLRGWAAAYTGFDISEDMLKARKITSHSQAEFVNVLPAKRTYDYVVASGIFNVRMHHADEEWEAYIRTVLDELNTLSTKAFSFNMLTSYSDPERRRDYLYYANPCFFFDLCQRKYSRNVALLHNYGLYEFTMVVVK